MQEVETAAEEPQDVSAAAPPSFPPPAEQLQALGDLIVALTESRSIGQIFSLLGRKLKALLNPAAVQVWMLGEDGRELHQVLTIVDDEDRLAAMLAEDKILDLEDSSFTSADAVRRRTIVVRRATEAVPARVAEIMSAGRIEMSVSIPIVARDEIHGAVNMMFRMARSFEDGDLRFFDALGRTVAVAVENARLMGDLRRERRWLQTVLDELPTGVLIAEGEEGRLTHANKAFRRMLGPVNGLDVSGFPDRFHATDPHAGGRLRWEDTALGRLLVDGEPSAAEYEAVGDDGVRRSLLVQAAWLNDPLRGEPAGVMAMQDVSGLKELERQNRRQAQLLQFTFDNVPAGIAILDAEKICYVQVNEQFAQFFGNPRITRKVLLHRNVATFYPGFDSSGLAALFRRVCETRVPFTAAAYEFDGFPRGRTYWNLSVLPLEEGGRVENLLVFAVEVTGLVETERRLRTALEDAEASRAGLEAVNRDLVEAVRVKDEFISTVSHELRTPLTPILGWSRILKDHGSEPSLLEQGLRAIERNVLAQVRLVDDLLDLSRLAYDKIRLNLQVVDVNALLRETWEQVRPEAEAKEIERVLALAEGPLVVHGDRLRLKQIFANLYTNAVKFSEERGRVEISSRRVRDRVEMSVADRGIGIDPEFLPRMFHRFQQARGGTTRRHGGLGIGLSIAKSLTEMHGGILTADSAGPDQGSRFTVSLPAFQEAPDPVAEPEQAPGLKGVRVLLADDDPDTLEVVGRLLELGGAEVRTAGNGLEAIDEALEEPPDVLLCDLQMTDIDGYQVAARLRAIPETAGVRQVALTGHGSPMDFERSRHAGFDAHLVKPVEPEELFATILSLLRARVART